MRIKVYNKFELAKLYFPNSSAIAAPLKEALAQEGYKRLAKTFTLRQTLLIYEYLGEPDNAYRDF